MTALIVAAYLILRAALVGCVIDLLLLMDFRAFTRWREDEPPGIA